MTNIRHRTARRDNPITKALFMLGLIFLAFTLASIATWMLAHVVPTSA